MSALILASKSKARIEMLSRAGLHFDISPANIDESAVKKSHAGAAPDVLAAELAFQKARHVSEQKKESTVIGSDSILTVGNQVLSKAADKNDAREKLMSLRGKTHRITSAVSVCRGGAEIWSHVEYADLTMKSFTDDFLERYVDRAGDVLTSCVGAYAIEEYGIRLFDKIQGDYFTILGMPLLPLLNFLEAEGVAA